MLCLENYSLLAACQSVPEWSDSTAVGRKFKLERTTCLVLCSAGVNKVASLFPLRAPLFLDGILPLAEKTWHIPRAPGVNTLCPITIVTCLGLICKDGAFCLVPSKMTQNRRQTVQSYSVQDGAFHPVFGERGSQVNENWKLRETSITKAIGKEEGSWNSLLCQRLHNQKNIVVRKAMTPTPACQMGNWGRRGKKGNIKIHKEHKYTEKHKIQWT